MTADQVTQITNAINSAIQNTLSMFIGLLPVMATICGVAFGIHYVNKLFNRVGNGK